MQLCDSAFVLAGYTVSETKERFPWKPNEAWISNRYPWPVPGKRITFTYRAPRKIVDECKGLTIRIVYELYDGAPILSKWIEIENNGQKAVTLDSFKSEVLALVKTAPKVHYGEPHEVRMMAQKRDTIRKIIAKDQYRQMLRVTISTVSPNCSSLRIMRWVEIWKR